MKKTPLSLLAAFCGLTSFAQLTTGAEMIIPNQMYCIHSELRNNTSLINTSNIYLLKGTNDTVWVFGMGYGLPYQMRLYRNIPTLNTSITQDSLLTDSIIRLLTHHPKIVVIAPHCHLDHINQAYYNVLDSVHRVYVHRNDFYAATCNKKCCGHHCFFGDQYFGVPYEWTPEALSKFRAIGRSNDTCGQVLKRLETSYGQWWVVKGDSNHTPGGIDLIHNDYQIRVSGADVSVCPTTFTNFPIHGDIPDTSYVE